ncbi:hypothetical protein CPI04_07090, partial [Moraxella catarrhalis]|nr:hypothetical protein [Moraxella catarrhalis]
MLAGSCHHGAILAESEGAQGRFVRGNDTNIARGQVKQLDLSDCSARKRDNVLAQFAQSERIIHRLVVGDLLWWHLHPVYADFVEQDYNQVCLRQANALDRRFEFERGRD